MEIRHAQIGDIPGMIGLLYQVGEVHHRIRPDIFRAGALKYNEDDLTQLLKDEIRPIFVAVESGEVLGYCFCQLRDYPGSGVSTRRKEIYIDDLCVHQDCRGQGIATALYGHTCSFARELGCDFITLNVWCGNDSAIRFYEHSGLTPRNITMEYKL